MSFGTTRVVLACVSAAVLAAVGCAGSPASPSASAAGSGTFDTSGSPRSGALHVTKECTAYTGQAGDFCTIASSNLKEIEVGSKVFYARAADFSTGLLESDVVLNLPGPGNNTASGHCHLNLVTGIGLCTFSGGTGKFTQFAASVNVSPPSDGVNWHWDGTYSFSPRD
jgi:hypothetical protein